MARPSNTDARRKQIALGLMSVMAKKGYDGASIGDIAKAARLSPGLVHYHFDDKLEVLAELAKHLGEENLNSLHQYLVERSDEPEAALNAIVDFFLGLGTSAKPEVLACWIALSGEALRHRVIKEVFEATLAETQQLVRSKIEQGVRAKKFSARIDALAAAAGIIALIQGYFVLAGTARTLIPGGSAAHTAKQMMRGLLGVKS